MDGSMRLRLRKIFWVVFSFVFFEVTLFAVKSTTLRIENGKWTIENYITRDDYLVSEIILVSNIYVF